MTQRRRSVIQAEFCLIVSDCFELSHLFVPPPPQLLSLAGRTSLLVCRVIIGLQQLQPSPAPGPGIDMQQVQCLVDEMGTDLSPGAQSLMEMVHFQQQVQ